MDRIPSISHTIPSPKRTDSGARDFIEAKIPLVTGDAFQQKREKGLRVYAYANRHISRILADAKNLDIAFALFDQSACLLKLYGLSEVLTRLREDGIQRGNLWSADAIGPNAVNIGLETRSARASVGAENACGSLRHYAIYFSPVIWKESRPPYELHGVYGVAVIVSAAMANPEHATLCESITDAILLQLHSQQMVYQRYDFNSGMRALITCDINTLNGRVAIFFHSKNLFDILHLKPSSILFKRADAFFDPLPHNQDFWEMLQSQSAVKEYHTPLYIQGKPIHCIISMDPYGQPDLNIRGVHLILTTEQQLTAQVSQKIGNRAIRTFDDIVGQSPAIRAAIRKGRMMSSSDSNVLIMGESGTGKDVFAQALHNASRRANGPFIPVNCGALPRDLIGSELFGYETGAFTGAKRQGNLGKFELANGGTLFLDEVGELPLDIQATLLRAVEQKTFMRIGGNKAIEVDVKIISATNANLMDMIAQRRFRSDLYYRLRTMALHLPPLRERPEDIVPLAESFARAISERTGRTDVVTFSEESKQLLMRLPWNGNVRELQNLIESIVQLYPVSDILPEHIQDNLDIYTSADHYYEQPINVSAPHSGAKGLLTQEDILNALSKCNGNRSAAARYLGIARKTLYRNMERLGLE